VGNSPTSVHRAMAQCGTRVIRAISMVFGN
jgi:hypothetical protein